MHAPESSIHDLECRLFTGEGSKDPMINKHRGSPQWFTLSATANTKVSFIPFFGLSTMMKWNADTHLVIYVVTINLLFSPRELMPNLLYYTHCNPLGFGVVEWGMGKRYRINGEWYIPPVRANLKGTLMTTVDKLVWTNSQMLGCQGVFAMGLLLSRGYVRTYCCPTRGIVLGLLRMGMVGMKGVVGGSEGRRGEWGDQS